VNPSAYWIDRTLAALDQAQDGAIVAAGNAAELLVSGEDVVAHSQHDAFEDQRVRQSDLVALLNRWRAAVVSELESALSLPHMPLGCLSAALAGVTRTCPGGQRYCACWSGPTEYRPGCSADVKRRRREDLLAAGPKRLALRLV
jgi:hypothetical protein